MSRRPEYPLWEDPEDGEWKALTLHPLFKVAEGIDRHHARRLMELAPEWEGKPGRYALLMHIVEEVGPRPTRFHRIDPIDPNGDLVPGNLEWALTLQRLNRLRKEYRQEAEEWLATHYACFCTELSYWIECGCPIASKHRYGE